MTAGFSTNDAVIYCNSNYLNSIITSVDGKNRLALEGACYLLICNTWDYSAELALNL